MILWMVAAGALSLIILLIGWVIEMQQRVTMLRADVDRIRANLARLDIPAPGMHRAPK